MTPKAGGKIITFYSYKGGTGRSMALANVAWILAANRKRVLVLDWDLEAPGLHRYYHPFLLDKDLTSSEGIIDFVGDFADEVITPADPEEELPPDWYTAHADILQYAVSLKFPELPEGGAIDFVPSGRQGPTYATRVNAFNWQTFYDRLGGWAFFEEVRKRVKEKYDYVLIDSRTGVSDTAGICTVQMPDTLVVLFTYNNQSIEGAAAVAQSVFEQRRKHEAADGGAGFAVYPVATRVDQAEQERLKLRRNYAQDVFDPVMTHLPPPARKPYWNDVEVPYIPYLAYEEVLAALVDDPTDPKNFLSSMIRLTRQLTGLDQLNYELSLSPERRQEILKEFAATPPYASSDTLTLTETVAETVAEEQSRLAESFLSHLTLEEQKAAQRLLLRLVRVARPEEGGEHSRVRVRLSELSGDEVLVEKMVAARLLQTGAEPSGGGRFVEVANEALIRSWKRLREWISADMEFLLWRQRLREVTQEWESSGQRKNELLLTASALRTAQRWLDTRAADLAHDEQSFIRQSAALEVRPVPRGHSSPSSKLRAFIISPFGKKRDREGKTIDYDEIRGQLIEPALDRLGLAGRTAVDIIRAGNLHVEMLQRLLTADLVVAEVSTPDANIFYELGIRHALRQQRTFMLRGAGDAYPFDLETQRLLVYDQENPSAALGALVEGLSAALNSTDQDSPVFRSLPTLKEQERANFVAVPTDFREEVESALAHKKRGDLSLLAWETRGVEWGVEGVRVVGRAQLKLNDYRGACASWEQVRFVYPDDKEANTWLGTIYQRLGDLVSSDQALNRVLANAETTMHERAEAYTLQGRNAKSRWIDDWRKYPEAERREQALRSPYLQASLELCQRAFGEDLNHFYSGMGALAASIVCVELATEMPEVWAERHDDEESAEFSLSSLRKQLADLAPSVHRSIRANSERLAREADAALDPAVRNAKLDELRWASISEADYFLLTSKRPDRVRSAYRKSLSNVPPFYRDSVSRQIILYRELDILKENTAAALEVVLPVAESPRPTTSEQPHAFVFTGHRIDAPDRAARRFPKEMEPHARAAIKEAVKQELQRVGGKAVGIAGGASGGDIIFHEVCGELGIPTQLYLALPREEYVKDFVEGAGPDWVQRFNNLYSTTPLRRELAKSRVLPRWLREKGEEYDIWQRSNLWILNNALDLDMKGGGLNVTLFALWDGKPGDAAGDTADMVAQAERRGAGTIIIPTP